uniref:Uncharacterized protein n=1 Tax=Anopheles atroparvus TaxID=41427 RepID=A0A182IUD8_ANOAO
MDATESATGIAILQQHQQEQREMPFLANATVYAIGEGETGYGKSNVNDTTTTAAGGEGTEGSVLLLQPQSNAPASSSEATEEETPAPAAEAQGITIEREEVRGGEDSHFDASLSQPQLMLQRPTVPQFTDSSGDETAEEVAPCGGDVKDQIERPVAEAKRENGEGTQPNPAELPNSGQSALVQVVAPGAAERLVFITALASGGGAAAAAAAATLTTTTTTAKKYPLEIDEGAENHNTLATVVGDHGAITATATTSDGPAAVGIVEPPQQVVYVHRSGGENAPATVRCSSDANNSNVVRIQIIPEGGRGGSAYYGEDHLNQNSGGGDDGGSTVRGSSVPGGWSSSAGSSGPGATGASGFSVSSATGASPSSKVVTVVSLGGDASGVCGRGSVVSVGDGFLHDEQHHHQQHPAASVHDLGVVPKEQHIEQAATATVPSTTTTTTTTAAAAVVLTSLAIKHGSGGGPGAVPAPPSDKTTTTTDAVINQQAGDKTLELHHHHLEFHRLHHNQTHQHQQQQQQQQHQQLLLDDDDQDQHHRDEEPNRQNGKHQTHVELTQNCLVARQQQQQEHQHQQAGSVIVSDSDGSESCLSCDSLNFEHLSSLQQPLAEIDGTPQATVIEADLLSGVGETLTLGEAGDGAREQLQFEQGKERRSIAGHRVPPFLAGNVCGLPDSLLAAIRESRPKVYCNSEEDQLQQHQQLQKLEPVTDRNGGGVGGHERASMVEQLELLMPTTTTRSILMDKINSLEQSMQARFSIGDQPGDEPNASSNHHQQHHHHQQPHHLHHAINCDVAGRAQSSCSTAGSVTTESVRSNHFESDKFYKFHIHEHVLDVAPGGTSSPETTPSVVDDDESFAGLKDLSNGTSTIRSNKGTVRGVKNRVRNGIATFLQMQQTGMKNYKDKEAGKVVVYSTSMGIVRETYTKCMNVKQILRTLLIKFEEKDIFMSNEYQQEIRERMQTDTISIPQVFVDGQHIGDAESIERLNESGELRKMLKPYKCLESPYMCKVCGGYRLLPCPSCGGSKKSIHRNHFTAEFIALKCMNCDEVGLVKCHNC